MLGEDGLALRLSTAPRGADGLLGIVDELLTELGRGVNDDTALLVLSVLSHPTSPAQEDR